MNLFRPLLTRKFVAVMGTNHDTAVVTGARRIYFESFLKSPPAGKGNASGDQVCSHRIGSPGRRKSTRETL
jgi:hypothetical protein